MRIFLLTIAALSSVRAQNVMDIVHTYSAPAASHYDRSRDYTYQKQVTTRRFKRDHTLKSSTSETYEVLIVNGNPVETLVQRNEKPVSEQESLNRRRELERASAGVRPPPRFEDRFDIFELAGEEELNGRRAWVVSARKSLHKGISHAFGKFWIDEADFECAKAQLETGGSLITIDGRAHGAFSASYEYMRVAEGIWLPTHVVHRADTSLPLTLFPISVLAQHQDHWELEYAYMNYKKFRADSQVVAIGEAAEPH